MAEPLRHRQTKEAETYTPGLPPPRHIPTLPRRQGADLVVEMGCFGARDGGHFDDLTAGHEWGQVLLAGERAFVDEGALQGEGRAHDREHVSGHIALDIDAETRLDAVIERRLKPRHSMSHLPFDGPRDGNLAAGVGDHLPVGFTELSAMDVFIVRTHQPGFAHRFEIAGSISDDMADDRHTGLPGERPIVRVWGCGQLPGHQL